MKKFPLDLIFNKYQEIAEISEKILDQLTESQLYAPTALEFCYHTLTFFDFKAEELDISNGESICRACKIVCEMCNWGKDIFAEELGLEPNPLDYVKNYMRLFLQYDSAPGEELIKLSSIVNTDLRSINTKIAQYEKIPFIQNEETPRNHGERTEKAFYDRCIEERNKINDYLANGIKKRALNKAAGQNPVGLGMHILESFFDRPYKSPFGYSEKLFDHTKIDVVSHRIGPILIPDANELKPLYATDKTLFYEKLLEKTSINEPLETLSKYADYLPLFKEQRKEIFKELIDLYKSEKWFGFYALGLAQIEGLFGDMCNLCDPQYNKPKATLPDKVNEIRPFYKGSELRLDYFQFAVPNQRNAFLHKGITTREDITEQQDIKTLCNDVLFDLAECVRIYGSLDIDANWLNRLIRNPDITEFHSVGSFCFYFRLVGNIKRNHQYNYFEDAINSLNKTVFPEYIFIIAYEIKLVYEQANLSLETYLNQKLSTDGNAFHLNTSRGNEIKSIENLIKSELTPYLPSEIEDQFKVLLEIKQFFDSYQSILDVSFFSNETENLLNEFYADEIKQQLKNVSQIANIIGYKK